MTRPVRSFGRIGERVGAEGELSLGKHPARGEVKPQIAVAGKERRSQEGQSEHQNDKQMVPTTLLPGVYWRGRHGVRNGREEDGFWMLFRRRLSGRMVRSSHVLSR